MADARKDPITTHVLDQTTGLPAKNVRVELDLPTVSSGKTWKAQTSPTDGRISSWPTEAGGLELHVAMDEAKKSEAADMVRGYLTFHTGEYFGIDMTFYPEVVVAFTINLKDTRQHWHVPVLLGPFGYTTYRGS